MKHPNHQNANLHKRLAWLSSRIMIAFPSSATAMVFDRDLEPHRRSQHVMRLIISSAQNEHKQEKETRFMWFDLSLHP